MTQFNNLREPGTLGHQPPLPSLASASIGQVSAPPAEAAASLLATIQALPDAVLCLNRHWRVTFANAEARRISRLTDDLIATKDHWEIFPETVGTDLERRYRRTMDARQPDMFEFLYEPFSVWVQLHILPTEEGIALYYRDITAQKLVEAESASLARQMAQVLEASPGGIVTVGKDWKFSFVNRRALEIVGTPDIVGHDIWELFPGNLLEPFQTAYRTAMDKRIETSFEAFHPKPLNLWVKVTTRPYEDGIIIFFSDITERKQAELRETATARRLEQVLDVTSDAVASVDREWRYSYLNGNAQRLIDPENRLLGKNIWEEFPDAAAGPAWEIYHRSMDEGLPGNAEIYYAEPINMWLSLQSQPTPDGIVVFFRDITEQKMHDELIRSQNELLEVVQRTARLATWELDPDTGHLTYGPGAYEVFGHPLEKVASLSQLAEVLIPGQAEGLLAAIEDAAKSTSLAVMEYAIRAADGQTVWVESRGQAVRTAEGPVRLRGMSIDITARKLDQLGLVASEERYRVLADLNPQAIWMGDSAGNITYANHGFLSYIGLTLENLTGLGWLDAFVPEDQERVVEVWTRSVTTGVDYDMESRLRQASTGEYRYWHLRAAPVRDASGAILHWLGVANDIHDAKTYAATLRAEQIETERKRAELETLYATTPVGLALLDPVDFRFLNLNDHEAEMLGYPRDRVLGRKLSEIAPPEGMPELMHLFKSVAAGKSIRDHLLEGELAARPGEKRAWSVNYSPVYNEDGSVRAISTASIEITNQKRAEAALIQSEKLAAVGRLASSISHEINNPLEAITNLLYLIAFDENLPEALKVYVHMAQSELSRVSQIATQTLRFHRQAVNPTPVTPAELVDAVVRLYTGRLANSDIKVDARYDTAMKVTCFENDIRQVLNNLIANAIDAMRTGGRLIIRAHRGKDFHGDETRSGVRITIADTGHGMSPGVVKRIFEPFYTTKDLQGTGLGLWISAGIVDRHKGRLSVRSTEHPVHHGTIFTLFLPCEDAS